MELLEFRTREYFLRVTKDEALRIAEDLIRQSRTGDCNTNRAEFVDKKYSGKSNGKRLKYFSISVRDEDCERERLSNLERAYASDIDKSTKGVRPCIAVHS